MSDYISASDQAFIDAMKQAASEPGVTEMLQLRDHAMHLSCAVASANSVPFSRCVESANSTVGR